MLEAIAAKLLGGSAAGLAETVAGIVDEFVDTEGEKQDREILRQKLQLAVNAAEAQHRTLFVAGWRPFVGWVCGVAFAYHFIAQPLLAFAAAWAGQTIALPQFDTSTLFYVLGGMLGLGGFRSLEKAAGKTR